MNLTWLDDFLALAATGNFSRAAEERHMTQPAFGRRIRALEEWLGVVLFDRGAHPSTLTEAGEWFRTVAQEMQGRVARLPEEARAVASARASTLRIAATHALSFTFLPGWLRTLESRLAAVSPVQLMSDTMQQCEALMLQGRAQFLLCHAHPQVPNRLDSAAYRSVTVGTDDLMPVSAADASGGPRFALGGSARQPPAAGGADRATPEGQAGPATTPSGRADLATRVGPADAATPDARADLATPGAHADLATPRAHAGPTTPGARADPPARGELADLVTRDQRTSAADLAAGRTQSATPVPLLVYSAESGIGRLVRTLRGAVLEGIDAKHTVTAHLASVLKTMVLDGRGVAWLPRSLIADELAAGRLVATGDADWAITVEIRLFRQAAAAPPAAEAFWREVVGQAAARVAEPPAARADRP